MMKKFRLILSIILVVCVTSTSLSFSKAQQATLYEKQIMPARTVPFNAHSYLPRYLPSMPLSLNHDDVDDPSFTPVNVSLQDDSFHNSNELQYTEWWYFDAELSNNYTMQFSIHVYNILTMSFISVNYNVYHDGISLSDHRTIYSFSDFNLSSEEPYIELHNGALRMIGILGPYQDTLYYHISYNIENSSMDLYYRSMTDGWKGTTSAGDWAVMLPKASVSGTLTINETKIRVSGTGYHDHNWNVTISAGLNFGWMWGKTNTESYTITWADILTTWFYGTPIIVGNRQYNGFYPISPEHITISVTKITFKDGFIIPYGFYLTGETDNSTITMDISVIDTDYTTILGIVNYWRYHVHTQGTITFDGHTETIDDYNIAEFIRFRFY
jgi:hypothetical protein